jgi:sialate O-acetylesterase
MAFLAVLCAFPVLSSAASRHSFRISNVFGDHMVLQRDRPVVVWGFNEPGVEVVIAASGAISLDWTTDPTLAARSDASGLWRITLPATSVAVTPTNFVFSDSMGQQVFLSDVLFGDVHICGGQSNMQFTLANNIPDMDAEISAADKYPLLRLFTVGQLTTATSPLQELSTIDQPWAVSSAEAVSEAWAHFSAVCWFTYREVFDALGGTVPMGLISNNWGGTPIEDWSSPEVLLGCNITTPNSILWNSMIMPYVLGPFAMKSAIWYQGESNVGNARGYACNFPAMIADWRRRLPGLGTFGFVVIAPWSNGYENTAAADLRDSQMAPLSSLPKIAFATTTDLVYPYSDPADIHPTDKQDVGLRLANQILAIEYGVAERLSPTPTYAGASSTANSTTVSVTVALAGCGASGCLLLPIEVPPGVDPAQTATWAVQTADGAWRPAAAALTAGGQEVVLTAAAAGGLRAVASSYGRATYPLNAAVSASGLPVLGWCFTLAGVPCYATVATASAPPARNATAPAKDGGPWRPSRSSEA